MPVTTDYGGQGQVSIAQAGLQMATKELDLARERYTVIMRAFCLRVVHIMESSPILHTKAVCLIDT